MQLVPCFANHRGGDRDWNHIHNSIWTAQNCIWRRTLFRSGATDFPVPAESTSEIGLKTRWMVDVRIQRMKLREIPVEKREENFLWRFSGNFQSSLLVSFLTHSTVMFVCLRRYQNRTWSSNETKASRIIDWERWSVKLIHWGAEKLLKL